MQLQVLDWAYGINQTLPVISLQDEDRLVILYICAHVAVIYDHTSNAQHLLQVRRLIWLQTKKVNQVNLKPQFLL